MIKAYLTDTIIIKTITYDKWGEGSEETETIKGRIEYKTKMVRNEKGEQVVSSARVMLESRTLGHKDKINFDSTDHAILNIAKIKDFNNQHIEVDVT